MSEFLGSIFGGIFKALFDWWLGKRAQQKAVNQANQQAEAISNEQQHLDQAANKEQVSLHDSDTLAHSVESGLADGSLRDESDTVQSAIDRANGKLP